MQVYREFRVLTARPSEAEMAGVPHRLYGFLRLDDPCSVGRWLDLALAEIAEAHAAGRLPIVVGGTGMYLSALTGGIADIPDVPAEVRAAVRARLPAEGTAALFAELARRDPKMAARLPAGDPQRVLRALEVLEATGISLADWQDRPAEPALTAPWQGHVLDLPRATLYARCDARFDAMLADGALDEVRAVADADPDLPAMRALGVPDLLRHLRGEIDLETARQAARQATRRFAKRQMTWFRNKMIAWNIVSTQEPESFFDEIVPKIRPFLLTRP
jgi:tRNA dimethylallyltransferase